MSSPSRAALSIWVLSALAAGCASGTAGKPPTADDGTRSDSGSVEKVWQAAAPGLSITRTPEGRVAVQLIQGPTSFYSSNEPLYVLDDVPFTPGPGGVLTGVNPYDIDTIKVLKNPADTAIYGVRGANGVILITTKKPPKSTG